jgi:VWFA-related protein
LEAEEITSTGSKRYLEMLKSNRLFTIILSWILIVEGSFAQTSPNPITIDVAVLSASGEPVEGLSKDDFLLFEDDRLQEIRGFQADALPYRILIIDECTGDPGNPRISNSFRNDSREIPFQTALISFLDVLTGHQRVAMAQFGKTLTMLRCWSAPIETSITILLRGLKESFGPDCRTNLNEATEHSFLEKLSWIESELENTRGRKAVVWFGPPKNLPGKLAANPTLTLRARGECSLLYNIENFQEFRTVRERLCRTGASFYFVISSEEFTFNFQNIAERKRLFFVALQKWAQRTGGDLVITNKLVDVEDLARHLNQDSGTGYSLSYHPLSQADGRNRHIKVCTRNPQLRVLQSPGENRGR